MHKLFAQTGTLRAYHRKVESHAQLDNWVVNEQTLANNSYRSSTVPGWIQTYHPITGRVIDEARVAINIARDINTLLILIYQLTEHAVNIVD